MGMCYNAWILEILIVTSQSVQAEDRTTRAAISVEHLWALIEGEARGLGTEVGTWELGTVYKYLQRKATCEVVMEKSGE